MTLYLVRHATAGVRDNTNSDDRQRELDSHGHEQANAIAGLLGDEPITAVFSSATSRCLQTVAPLASRLGLEVAVAPALMEGSSTSSTLALVRGLTGQTVVLCSHGDVIPDVLRGLTVGGTRLDGIGCAKGSIWKLDNTTERIDSGLYLGLAEVGR